MVQRQKEQKTWKEEGEKRKDERRKKKSGTNEYKIR